MEDTLRASAKTQKLKTLSLNPCFNGRYSQSQEAFSIFEDDLVCLNPCFNGRYSQSAKNRRYWHDSQSLNPCFNGRYSQRKSKTIKYYNTLWGLNPCFNGRYSQSTGATARTTTAWSLNPCFNGRYSQSAGVALLRAPHEVLILVLMEDTLREL